MARLIPSGLQLCPNCNAELPRNLAVCPHCGAGLSGLISSPPIAVADRTIMAAPVMAGDPVVVVPRRPGINVGGILAALLLIALAVAVFRYGLFAKELAAVKQDASQVSKSMLKEPARPQLNLPAGVPKIAPASLGLLGFDYTPPATPEGKFTYTMTLQNTGGLPGIANVRVKFYDKAGVTLEEDLKLGLVVPAGEKTEVSGEKQLDREKAVRVVKVVAKLT